MSTKIILFSKARAYHTMLLISRAVTFAYFLFECVNFGLHLIRLILST